MRKFLIVLTLVCFSWQTSFAAGICPFVVSKDPKRTITEGIKNILFRIIPTPVLFRFNDAKYAEWKQKYESMGEAESQARPETVEQLLAFLEVRTKTVTDSWIDRMVTKSSNKWEKRELIKAVKSWLKTKNADGITEEQIDRFTNVLYEQISPEPSSFRFLLTRTPKNGVADLVKREVLTQITKNAIVSSFLEVDMFNIADAAKYRSFYRSNKGLVRESVKTVFSFLGYMQMGEMWFYKTDFGKNLDAPPELIKIAEEQPERFEVELGKHLKEQNIANKWNAAYLSSLGARMVNTYLYLSYAFSIVKFFSYLFSAYDLPKPTKICKA